MNLTFGTENPRETSRLIQLVQLIIVIIIVAFAVSCGFYARDTMVLQGTAMLPSFRMANSQGQKI